MIKTKEELFKSLQKTKKSALDEIIEYKVSEALLRNLIESAEKEENYWLEVVEKKDKEIKNLKKEISYWKGQYKAKLKRDKNKETVSLYEFKKKILSLLKEDENKNGIPIKNLQDTINYLEKKEFKSNQKGVELK